MSRDKNYETAYFIDFKLRNSTIGLKVRRKGEDFWPKRYASDITGSEVGSTGAVVWTGRWAVGAERLLELQREGVELH